MTVRYTMIMLRYFIETFLRLRSCVPGIKSTGFDVESLSPSPSPASLPLPLSLFHWKVGAGFPFTRASELVQAQRIRLNTSRWMRYVVYTYFLIMHIYKCAFSFSIAIFNIDRVSIYSIFPSVFIWLSIIDYQIHYVKLLKKIGINDRNKMGGNNKIG